MPFQHFANMFMGREALGEMSLIKDSFRKTMKNIRKVPQTEGMDGKMN